MRPSLVLILDIIKVPFGRSPAAAAGHGRQDLCREMEFDVNIFLNICVCPDGKTKLRLNNVNFVRLPGPVHVRISPLLLITVSGLFQVEIFPPAGPFVAIIHPFAF